MASCENEHFIDDDFGTILEASVADEEIVAAVATKTITLTTNIYVVFAIKSMQDSKWTSITCGYKTPNT